MLLTPPVFNFFEDNSTCRMETNIHFYKNCRSDVCHYNIEHMTTEYITHDPPPALHSGAEAYSSWVVVFWKRATVTITENQY